MQGALLTLGGGKHPIFLALILATGADQSITKGTQGNAPPSALASRAVVLFSNAAENVRNTPFLLNVRFRGQSGHNSGCGEMSANSHKRTKRRTMYALQCCLDQNVFAGFSADFTRKADC